MQYLVKNGDGWDIPVSLSKCRQISKSEDWFTRGLWHGHSAARPEDCVDHGFLPTWMIVCPLTAEVRCSGDLIAALHSPGTGAAKWKTIGTEVTND